ncbi:MAG: haloalkane dehalogenase [Methylocystaceae bacterium]|nr:haloalkane dehalogenase [Methylocystaceae bacterium]
MLEKFDGYKRNTQDIDGVSMAYIDIGDGDPIVFLHGNPTSSYIWRNILPSFQTTHRCIAPDLVGMGDSAKLPDSGPDKYTYLDQRHYLFGLLNRLNLDDNVTLVLHDWGGALGLDWARNHADRIKGVAFMEPMLMPLTWEKLPASAIDAFKGFRAPGIGEDMCLKDNIFVEQVIPMAVLRNLDPKEMEAYRAPFKESGEDRRATLTWPRQIPINGESGNVAAALNKNCEWLKKNTVKKLFIRGEPGMMITGPVLEFCRSLPALTEVVVPGAHYMQEDSPEEIAQALTAWL